MIDVLIRGAIALAGYLAVDHAVRVTTGEGITERVASFVFRGWCSLRDQINAWVNAHPDLKIAQVVGSVTDLIDEAAVRAKQAMNFLLRAKDRQNHYHTIGETTISADELVAKYSGLRRAKQIVLEH